MYKHMLIHALTSAKRYTANVSGISVLWMFSNPYPVCDQQGWGGYYRR